MPYITKFAIENYKGIKRLSLSMPTQRCDPIITLVGLNESGKTTILEALSLFATSVGTISESSSSSDSTDPFALVPIQQKENFTGEIKIIATIKIEASDKEAIERFFAKENLLIDKEKLPEEFKISTTYQFRDGDFVKSLNLWDLKFHVKKTKRARNYKPYRRPSSEEKENGAPDLWLLCIENLEESLPSIAYFPTFLVDIPDKIYLAHHTGERPQQKHYRKVLQDVLDRDNRGIKISRHVVRRVTDFFKGEDVESFPDSNERRQVLSVIKKIEALINKEVIRSWKNIFKRDVSTLRVVLEWDVDREKGNIPYVRFFISDGESQFILNERSLGFRWFFLFLLFTRFKRDENRPTIFLFDEPAANLHARAQQELLESFNRVIENKNKIVYSTHSAYMVNPKWLFSAYIVENEAIDYVANDIHDSLSSNPTSILVTPYRRFAGSNPGRLLYFQPILDKLDHVSSALEPGRRVILTEGISDFHAFSFYCGDILKKHGILVQPGCGAGAHDIQISILIRQGTQFIVVLDDDDEGRRAAERYREKWLLDRNFVVTVGEINSDAEAKKLETLLSDETRDVIAKHFMTRVKDLSKKQIGLYFAEVNAQQVCEKKSVATEKLMRSIVEEAASRILRQAGEEE